MIKKLNAKPVKNKTCEDQKETVEVQADASDGPEKVA